jgi:uncharacterized phage infection (PIP) family protein YhgE
MSAPSGPDDPFARPQSDPAPAHGGPPGAPGPGGPGWGPPAGVPAPPEPREVTISFWLWVASIVVGVVGAIAAFSMLSGITEQVVAATGGGGRNSGAVTTAITAALVVGAVFGVVLIALELLFTIFMRRGRNWARIVLTIVGGLGVLSAVAGLATGSTTRIDTQVIETRSPLTTVLSLVQAVLIVVAIVMFFRKPANDYFAAHGARR